MQQLLDDLCKPYPQLQIFYAGQSLYQQFRIAEQHLVSILDKGQHKAIHQILALRAFGIEAGMTSYTIHENSVKKIPPRNYARIDLVIVPEELRGLGVARVVVLAALIDLLMQHGEDIYSISCLAGHEAVARILTKLAFQEGQKKEGNFRHFELRLENFNSQNLVKTFESELALALQFTNYRFRQRK